MPGMVTNYGVLYAQYAVPLAAAARLPPQQQNSVAKPNKDDGTTIRSKQLLLQYWVLHALTQGFTRAMQQHFVVDSTSTHFISYLVPLTWMLWYKKGIRPCNKNCSFLGLLPGEAAGWESTRTSRIFNMVLALIAQCGPTLTLILPDKTLLLLNVTHGWQWQCH
jgi:hypothetical protein